MFKCLVCSFEHESNYKFARHVQGKCWTKMPEKDQEHAKQLHAFQLLTVVKKVDMYSIAENSSSFIDQIKQLQDENEYLKILCKSKAALPDKVYVIMKHIPQDFHISDDTGESVVSLTSKVKHYGSYFDPDEAIEALYELDENGTRLCSVPLNKFIRNPRCV